MCRYGSRRSGLAGPPLVNLLIDALLGSHARAADPETAALVGGHSGGPPAGDVRRHRIGQPPPARSDPLFAKISAPTLICVAVGDPYWTPRRRGTRRRPPAKRRAVKGGVS